MAGLIGARIPRLEDGRCSRQGPLRRRHRAARRAACRVRAQPASACADPRRRQARGAGAARRACGAHARRSRAGAGQAPHGAALQFRHAARQGCGRSRSPTARCPMSASRSRSWSPTTATSPRTPPRWSRSTTTCCPSVADCRKAVAPTRRAVRRELNTNIIATYKVAFGDADAAFAKAAHVFHEELWQHRGAAHPIEARGILAEMRAATTASRCGPRPRRRTTCSSR